MIGWLLTIGLLVATVKSLAVPGDFGSRLTTDRKYVHRNDQTGKKTTTYHRCSIVTCTNVVSERETGRDINMTVDCPSSEECLMKCPLGYKKDKRGCPLCEECETEGVFESDIVVDTRSYGSLLRQYGVKCENQNKTSRGGMASLDHQWPLVNGEVKVPYTFHRSIAKGSDTYNMIMRAIKEYQDKTCIRLVNRTTESNYIEFISTSGCQSYIGMIGGKQGVWISQGCDVKIGTTLHELMHALGFWHEQSRGDRDDHVKVLWNNIDPNFKSNFEKQSHEAWKSYGSPYDFGSVMHYGGYYFSKRSGILPTIVNKFTNEPTVGQRDGFSTQDLYQINKKYGCTAYLKNETETVNSLPVTTTSTATPFVEPCVDQSNVCQLHLEYCKNPYIKTTLCPKSCKYCTSEQEKIETTTPFAGPCIDNSTVCELYLEKGHCETTPYVKTHLCPKTCKYCKSEKEKITTTTETATTTQTPFTGPCVDNSTVCHLYQERGYCESTAYVRTHLCPKTCRYCTSAKSKIAIFEKCIDQYKDCPAWKKYCKSLPYYMNIYCNKTCEVCSPTLSSPTCQDLSEKCPTTATECNNKPEVARKFCRKSCGYCGISDQCGVPVVSPSKRIVGGFQSLYKSRPWIANIHNPQGKSICGGSLISMRFIITAAHCFSRAHYKMIDQYFAYLGKHHFSQDVYDEGQKRVEFLNGTIHPDYDSRSFNNDFALIELRAAVDFNDYIKPICLPKANVNPVIGSYAVVSGWGTIGNSAYPKTLQETKVRIINRKVCNKWFFKNEHAFNAVNANMFCAGYQQGGKDACHGDSGGPLEQVVGGKHYLVGVVSWGYGCAQTERPGVYAQVSKKVNWITSTVGLF